jgi:AcrR family transcriptional regulator
MRCHERSVVAAPSARERILSTAYELFTRRGIHGVGVDEVIEKASVAKATLYRHFPSKDDLVVAFLQRREQLWTAEVIDRQPRELTDDPEGQLLAVFDLLDERFRRRADYEAWSFVKVLFEVGTQGPVGRACAAHLDKIRGITRERAERAGLRDPEGFAWALNNLIKGAIVSAAEGDSDAARRVKPMAAWLIEHHRRPPEGSFSARND